MADEDKRLFPELPEDLKALSDDERGKLLADHEAAKELILEDNAEFLGDLTANEIIAQLEEGVAQIKQIKEVSEELKAEFENYQATQAGTGGRARADEGRRRGLRRRGRLEGFG